MSLESSNPVVENALRAKNAGTIDYSSITPRDRWEVLDDLETIGGDNRAADVEDLKKIKPYAQKFGVMDEFNRVCAALGIRV